MNQNARRRWTLHGEHVEMVRDERDGLAFEPEAWTTPAWIEGDLDQDESIEVIPVAEHEAKLGQLRALLPKVYDGIHLIDCPYVDVLLRIKKALDAT